MVFKFEPVMSARTLLDLRVRSLRPVDHFKGEPVKGR